ncbi:hypothetical protein DsansV1_C02g0015311 [Dioscorea sansibarensis]
MLGFLVRFWILNGELEVCRLFSVYFFFDAQEFLLRWFSLCVLLWFGLSSDVWIGDKKTSFLGS